MRCRRGGFFFFGGGEGGATLPVPYTPPPIPHFTYRPITYLLCCIRPNDASKGENKKIGWKNHVHTMQYVIVDYLLSFFLS